MFLLEVGEVFVAELFGPPKNRVAFRLRTRVLRREGQSLTAKNGGSLGTIEGDEVSLIIIQIAEQVKAKIRIIVKGLDKIGVIASVLKMEQSSGGLRSFGHRVGSGDELNTRHEVDEQIACEAFAVIGETAPAEKPHWIELPLGRVPEESIPIDGLLARIRRNWVDPRAAWRVAVPVTLNVIHLAEFPAVEEILRLRINDR